MDTKNKLHISVRNLVEFIFREGDIDNRNGNVPSADAMMQGSRLHRKIQEAMGADYQSEVPLKYSFEEELYELTIDGRADGIFVKEDGLVVIDEIKGVFKNVEYMEQPIYVHQAQAMCYAYIFALQNELEKIAIQMTYVNLDTEEKKYFQQFFSPCPMTSYYCCKYSFCLEKKLFRGILTKYCFYAGSQNEKILYILKKRRVFFLYYRQCPLFFY